MFADRAGEFDERFQAGAGGPRQPRVEPLDGLVVGQSVDVAQLAVEQERAIHATVGEHDLGELEQLLRGLVDGVLEQAVASAFDPLPFAGARAAVRVVLLAADLVGGFAAELDHMKGIERDLRVRDRSADRFLIAGAHVDRDCPDRRFLLVGELVEERLQAGGVAALGRPHDRAALVVDHRGQEPVIGTV